MDWNLEEAVSYYRRQGAPGDQTALKSLLQEIQEHHDGAVPVSEVEQTAEKLGVKASFLLALIRRMPSLKLAEDKPCLELCGGPNCPKKADLAGFVRRTYGQNPAAFTWKQVGCMHQCGKGPNLRWKGQIHNHADEALIRSLVE